MSDERTEREKQYEQLARLHQLWSYLAHGLSQEIRAGRMLPVDHDHRAAAIQNLTGLIGVVSELLGQLTEGGAEELRQLLVEHLQK